MKNRRLTVWIVCAIAGWMRPVNSFGGALAEDRLAWYKFNEIGGITATNSAGPAGNGTLYNGPVWSSGSLLFDGMDDYVQTPVQNGSARTLAAWINPRTSDPAGGSIESVFDCDVPGNYGSGWGLNNKYIYVMLDDQVWNTGIMISFNQWQHVCVTFDSSTVRVYLNGVKKGALNYTQGPVTTTVAYKIGRSNANSLFFDGYIKEAKIYSRAVTDLEVLTIQSTEAPAPDTAPTTLTAAGSAGCVSLSWQAPGDGETWYTLRRSQTSGGPYSVLASNVLGTSYADTNVTNGTTYYYVAATANIAGTGPNSTEASATPVAGTIFYVDPAGSDINSGMSTNTPWKSIAKVNATTFKGGDQILFKRGGSWTGTLSPGGAGTLASQITLGSYGTGAKPFIDSQGAGAGIAISGQSYWTIDGFEVTSSVGGGDNRCGIRVGGGGDGSTIRKVRILNNDVHDIQATPNVNDGARNWGGIFVWIDEPGKADDVLIQGNNVVNAYGQGISFWAEFEANGMNYANCSPNVVVRGNRVWRTSGDGILVLGGDNELVEYNEVGYAGVLTTNGNAIAAAWPSRHRDGVWQYNHVHHTKWQEANDSTAFDNDGYVFGTTFFQYNYTHDNEGGFHMEYYWDYDYGKTVSRYNLSVNDGRGTWARVYFSNRPGSELYNNVFYNPGMTLDVSNGGAGYHTFRNNIFVGADRSASFGTQGVYYNNHFFGGVTRPTSANGNVTGDPLLVNPNTIGDLTGFILQSSSPCRNSGQAVASNGGLDFWSVAVPASPTQPHRGMSQINSSSGYTSTSRYVHVSGPYTAVLPASGAITASFSATVHDQNFRPMATPSVTWSVEPALSGYSISSSGVLTLSAGAQPQRVAIVAASGTVTNSFSMSVLPANASSTWINASGGDWMTADNWQGGIIANGVDQTSTFALSTGVTVNQTSASQTLGHLAFSSADHTIQGNPLTLDVSSGAPTVSVAGSAIATLDAPVTGSDGLTKTGTGTLALSGGLNYSGTTAINGGTLRNGAAAGVSYALGVLTLNGGTLAALNAGDSTKGNFQLGGDVTVGGSTQSVISADVRVGNSVNRTFDVGDTGDPSDVDLLLSGTLGHYSGQSWGYATKTGAGSMKLSGVNAIGSLTVSAGKMILENNGIGGMWNGGLVNSAQTELSVTDGNTVSWNDSLKGSGAYSKTGVGTLNVNSFADAPSVTVSAGTLHMSGGHNNYWAVASTVIGTGGLLSNNTHSHIKDLDFAGGTLSSTGVDGTWGGWMLDNNISVTADSGTSTISASQVAVANATDVTRIFTVGTNATLNVTGNFIDAPTTVRNRLTKAGTGTMILANANSYSGVTDIQAGTLVAANNTALGPGGWDGNTMTWIRNGGTLALQGGVSLDEHIHVVGDGVGGFGAIRSLSGDNVLSLTYGGSGSGPGYAIDGNTVVGVDLGSLTMTGFYHDPAYAGSGLTKVGSGKLVLTAEQAYTGGTTVSGGILEVPGYGGRGRLFGALTVNPGGAVVTTGDGTGFGWVDQISTVTNSGVITSAGTIHIWNIPGGITLKGGTLQCNNGISDPNGPQLEWNRTAVMTLPNAAPSVIAGRIRIRDDGGYAGLAFDVADGDAATDLLVSAAITEASGGRSVMKTGAGTLMFSGTNSYSGVTTVNGGTLILSQACLADGAAVQVADGAKIQLGFGGDDMVGSLVLAGVTLPSGRYNALTHPSYFSGPGSLVCGGSALAWDNGGNTSLWGDSALNWSGTSWLDGADALFAHPTAQGTVTLSGSRTASAVKIGNGGNNANYTLTSASGASLRAGSLAVRGEGPNHLGTNPTAALDGATMTLSGSLSLGRANLVIKGVSQVTVDSIVGIGDWGDLTIQDNALVTAVNGFNTGALEAWGLNLNGGILVTTNLYYAPHTYVGSTKLFFNGTLVKPTGDNPAFIGYTGGDYAAPEIGGGGAKFDTDGHAIGLTLGLTGGGALIKSGSGTLTLSSGNSHGGTSVEGGTLAVNGSGTLGNGWVAVRSGAVLDLGATTQNLFGDLNGSGAGNGAAGVISNGTVNLNGRNAFLQNGVFTMDLTGGGNSRLWIGGDANATVELGGNNSSTFTDNNSTIIGYGLTGNAGIVKLLSAAALGPSGQHAQVHSGTLDLNGQSGITVSSIMLNNGNMSNSSTENATYSGTLTFYGTTTATIGGAGDITLSGSVVDGGFTKNGAGSLTLSGANTYSGGTTIQNGTVKAAHAGALPGAVTLSGGTLEIGVTGVTCGALSGSGALKISGGQTLTVSGDVTASMAIEVADLAGLDKKHSYTLVTANTKPSGTYALVNGTYPWTLRVVGNSLVLRPQTGTLFSVY